MRLSPERLLFVRNWPGASAAPGRLATGPQPTMRQILVVNQGRTVPPDTFAAAVAAVQSQLELHFQPAWGLTAALTTGAAPPTSEPPGPLVELVRVLDDSDEAGLLGYHGLAPDGRPGAFVFARTSERAGVPWTVTLSHEVLEQLADPFGTLAHSLADDYGPYAIAHQVCDPVERDEYELAGVRVSNFVLPAWFNAAGPGGPWDYLGRLAGPLTLSRGGYCHVTRDLVTWQLARGEGALHGR